MNVIRYRTCQFSVCHGLILVTAILFCLWRNFEPDAVQAQSPSLAEDVLKKVKNATVSLRVKFEGGSELEGTGWFVEPGLIATNAHVVGFLGAASQKPQPITPAEIITPNVARTVAVHARCFSASKSTCIAPANNR